MFIPFRYSVPCFHIEFAVLVFHGCLPSCHVVWYSTLCLVQHEPWCCNVLDQQQTHESSRSSLQVITITGTGFDESNIDAHRIWVGPKECYVRSVTANTITCRARGAGTFGELPIFALVGAQFASGSLFVTGKLEIHSISHERGSQQGGTILTIDGAGFAVEGSVFSTNFVSIGVSQCRFRFLHAHSRHLFVF